MEYRQFGNTGISVSALGFGAGHIGSPEQDEDFVGTLLNRVLDLGITLFDTARGYGLSEERIGRHLSWRRQDFILSTKVGYGVEGVPDWTYQCIHSGIDQALERLQSDYIDIVHLHSCEKELLEAGEVIRALEEARAAGKVRAIAYSGDNDALDFAVQCGRFDSIETSVNLCDQRVIKEAIQPAAHKGMGVIAKRPVANAPWRFAEEPTGHYAEEYWKRWQAMDIDPEGIPWQELALRFTLGIPGLTTAIAGTANLEHLAENIAIAEKGPLPEALQQKIYAAFQAKDDNWIGQT